MRKRLEYAAAWALLKFLGVLPRRPARWIAAQVALFLFRLRPAWRRAALFNLRLAFPDWPEAKRRSLVRTMVRNLGWMAAEFARFPRYTRQTIAQAIVLDDFENFAAAERRGKGVLFLTGHMGAWELMPFAHALYHQPLHFLVRPIDNPRVDALVEHYRCLSGNRPIQKNQSARPVLRILGKGGTVGILADQNTALEEAVFADFFGVPAATSSGIARLARRSGAAVVPAYGYWDPSLGKYRLHYEPELELSATDDEQADIQAYTARFNQSIEDYVRRFPDQWLWVHRRWRNRPPGEKPIYPDEQPDESPDKKPDEKADGVPQ
jgi:KDO2-lipid IV(A) lauroyltransferase